MNYIKQIIVLLLLGVIVGVLLDRYIINNYDNYLINPKKVIQIKNILKESNKNEIKSPLDF